MKALHFADIRHFSFEESTSLHIGDFDLKTNQSMDDLDSLIENPLYWNTLGNIFKKSLVNNPFFFASSTLEAEEDCEKTMISNLLQIESFIDFLWFAKDCSCHVHNMGVCLEGKRAFMMRGNYVRYNAHSTKENTSFNYDDIGLLLKLNIAIAKLIKSNTQNAVERSYYSGETYIYERKLQYHDINKAERILIFLRNARQSPILPERISNFVVIVESLFSNNTKDEIQHKVAERLAFYLGKSYPERLELFAFIKTCYGVRSKFIHGSRVDYKVNSKMNLTDVSVKLDKIVRKLLIKVYLDDSDKFFDETRLDGWFNEILFNRVFSQTLPSAVE